MRTRALVLTVVLIALAWACSPLGPTGAVEAPRWARVTFGPADVDFVGAIDLAAVRADSIFGPLIARLARKDDAQVLLHASQLDVVGSMTHGRPDTWIGAAHGVEGPPGPHEVGSEAGDVVTLPGAWVIGKGPAFEHLRASPPGSLPPVVMPSRALVASTVRGAALPRPRERELADTTDGMTRATGAILGGAHLEVVVECEYVDTQSARRAATAARLVLLAAASGGDGLARLARALLDVDLDVSGTVVSVRVTLSDDLRDLLQSYVERQERD